MAKITMDGHEITKLVLTPASGSSVTKNLVATNSFGSSDEGKVVSNGALKAQTSLSVSENGTYNTTDKNSVVVNVTSTSGGIHTETGYVELNNVEANTITIPVDLTSATGFVANIYAVETGEVSEGVVTKYTDRIEIPTGFVSPQFVWGYMMKMPLNQEMSVYRDSENLSTIANVANVTFTCAQRAKNGAQVQLVNAPTAITDEGTTFPTGSASRKFCTANAYVKFKYDITWW